MTAYQQGRFDQLSTPEMKAVFPYWEYSATIDQRTRVTHRMLHGLVLPADSDRWMEIWPPRGFNCRCTVQGRTGDWFSRKGLPVPKKGEYQFNYTDTEEPLKLMPQNEKGKIIKGKNG